MSGELGKNSARLYCRAMPSLAAPGDDCQRNEKKNESQWEYFGICGKQLEAR